MIGLRGCRKAYTSRGGQPPLTTMDGVNLTIQPRESVCLLGPSGHGKTTLLKAVAELAPLNEGEVRIDGQPVTGPGFDRAMVLQDFALLPERMFSPMSGLHWRSDVCQGKNLSRGPWS